MLTKECLVFLLIVKIISATHTSTPNPTPIVLWHGMGDTCCISFSLGYFKRFLQNQIPSVYVISLRIGNNYIEDFESGYFKNPNWQVDYVCDQLAADKKLANGFNLIGFSQGGQFSRALVERCGHKLPRIKNLITLGAQHQGVYGLPHCGALQTKTCDYIRKLLNHAAYISWVQDTLVQATYWHDPLHEQVYRNKSIFLADINNERKVNKTYIGNLVKLDHFIMVMFEGDSMVEPKESAWFGYYAPGQSDKVISVQESGVYLKDRLGLKRMDKAGKLVFLSVPGDHLQFSQEWFIENILTPYLK